MRSFSFAELAYDVAMRRNIPVNILFTSLTKEQQTVLIIKYCLTGCDIGSAFFGIGKKSVFKRFKRMIQGALKCNVSGTERSWPRAFIKLSKVYLHSVYWSNI